MELNIQQIMEILPHRPPFLLVDKITECEPGVKATGIKCVTMNEPFFTGHFPGQPIMPGVLILEALAQTGAVAALSLPENKGKLAIFGGVKNCRFKQQVVCPASWWSSTARWDTARRWPRWAARWPPAVS